MILIGVVGVLCSMPLLGQKSREVRKSGPLASDGRVFIDTYKGSITVRSWDKPEIEILARIEPDDYDRYAEEKVRDTEIRIDGSSSSYRIKTDYEKVRNRSGGFWGIFDGDTGSLPFVHYTLSIPRTARLSIKDYKSTTNLSGLSSDVELDTYKGTVEIVNLKGSLILETYKGEVRVDFASLAGRSKFQTYKGEIEIALSKQQGFDLDLNIGSSGSWRTDFAIDMRGGKGRKKSFEYWGPVNGGGPKLQLKTTKGSLKLVSR